MALTQQAQRLIEQHFEQCNTSIPVSKRLAIDATCGNGFDTEFLCRLGFDRVIGFDIQAQAITTTQQRLDLVQLDNAQLIEGCHSQLATTVLEPIDCAMFNFGYLPRGDKTITTEADTSVRAIKACLDLLTINGVMTLMCYPGHAAGVSETKSIEGLLDSLPTNFIVTRYDSEQASASTPVLFMVRRCGARKQS